MRNSLRWMAAAAALAALPSGAQMHRVAKKENVTRAVAVYEWTGDFEKPTASRLVPVSLFVDGRFEDAGLYLARPVPLALESDIRYELDDAGQPKAFFDLEYARNLKPAPDVPNSFDQGWTGYGRWRALPAEKKPEKVNLASTEKETAKTPEKDPGRPTFGRRPQAAGGGNTGGSGDTSSNDRTDRKKNDKNAPQDQSGVRGVPDSPQDDSERPTLKKRTAQEKKEAIQNDTAAVSNVGDLNNDPDRPKIKRGVPAEQVEMPRLAGVMKTMQQMVAVSDAAQRTVHDFHYRWREDSEKQEIQAKLEKIANSLVTPPAAPAATPPKGRAPAVHSKMRRGVTPDTRPAAPPTPLLSDVKLSAFELSYNSAPVFVLEAHTNGEGVPIKYVTVVAQSDTFGEPQVAMKQVADSTRLDTTPWMRLIGAVDADASNRASLLMEMRGQTSRQFTLFRVIGGQSSEVYRSGTTQ